MVLCIDSIVLVLRSIAAWKRTMIDWSTHPVMVVMLYLLENGSSIIPSWCNSWFIVCFGNFMTINKQYVPIGPLDEDNGK
jgi:hypothetical protein